MERLGLDDLGGGLDLRRLGGAVEAGLCQVSLPWRPERERRVSMGGIECAVEALGSWPGGEGYPRRLLCSSAWAGIAPEVMSLRGRPGISRSRAFDVSMELLEESEDPCFAWERHGLKVSYEGRSMTVVLGLRTGGAVHWWEACRLVVKSRTVDCTTIEMGGAIPREIQTGEDFVRYPRYTNPFLHRHNWLSGSITARLHGNGVCEFFVHHINNQFVDEGRDLEDVVPVIGFFDVPEPSGVQGPGTWDGSQTEIEWPGVRLDVREAARLATPEAPGRLDQIDGNLVWQPYEGVELFGGACPLDREGDGYIFRSENRLFPRGMARTVRFTASLSEASPVVVRYLAPDWWHGLCEDFQPKAVFPVRTELELHVDEATDWVNAHILNGGFEDGALPRLTSRRFSGKAGRERFEPGWEGEIPYAQLLAAYRSGDAETYDNAIRSAYFFTDCAINHASKLVRMHGYAPPAASLPMHRVQGTLMAYLETGDGYLRDAAEAVVGMSHWQHKNSWPRMAVGRDACYGRSAVLLHRYLGKEFYRDMALELALSVADSQRSNGSFGDQGGGSGIHQWSGYVTKPWMGLLALGGVLDLLELGEENERLKQCVKRFADWLMEERIEWEGRNVWAYQHDYRGERHFFSPVSGESMDLPSGLPWHHLSLARLMGYCSRAHQDPSYVAAWEESMGAYYFENGDHSAAAAIQFLPWLAADYYSASWKDRRLAIESAPYSPHPWQQAEVSTPFGTIDLFGSAEAPRYDDSTEVAVAG